MKGAALIFLAVLGLSSGINVPVLNHCNHLYPIEDTGVTVNFHENIGHAIHSMTVQGLRLFNPRATVDNGVPTVNSNVSALNLVVPNAPDDPIGKEHC